MKKSEAEAQIRSLCHDWRDEAGLAAVPPEKLQFSSFYAWLKQRSPNCLQFRSPMSPEYFIELWFDQEFNQIWQR